MKLARGLPGLTNIPMLLLCTALLGGCGALNSINPWSDHPDATDDNGGVFYWKSENTNKIDLSKVPPDQLYSNGIDALNKKRLTVAVHQFDAVEQYYPYSSWATNAQLMHGYADYLNQHYTDAIGALDRFVQLHPTSRSIAYAYYLRALSFYEQISDIERDQKGTELALTALQEVTTRFPDSAYARDARLKVDLCRDHLAGKEMEVGRFYENQHQYQAAIGRFQRVVDEYQTTNHTPEALHRLTEIYLALGMVNEARRTAAVLGYNYPGSSWYEASWDQLVSNHDITGPAADDSAPGLLSRTWHSVF